MSRPPRGSSAIEGEVLIIGAGPVGATLAIALDSAGVDVALVDRQDLRRGLDGGSDGRAFAIADASQRAQETLGIWRRLGTKAAPIREIRVSEAGSRHVLHYDHRDLGDRPLGYMVESRSLRAALLARLAECRRVRLLAPVRLLHVERSDRGARAHLEDGTRIRARLVVAADGRSSETRAAAGIRVTGWSYPQHAIVCTVSHERHHRFIAHEHFLPAGPFAILPLVGDRRKPGHRSSIVWTERDALAPAIMGLDDAAFLRELGRRFGDFLGALSLVGPRWSHHLGLQFAETAIASRLALVGDADHSFHPIAGQGLNMGFRDAAALAEVLIDARRLGLDIGTTGVLERYRRWRRFDNLIMLASTDGLNRLFSNSIRPLRLARDLGLGAVDRLPPLKRLFMRHAMGVLGDTPRLMRGRAL